MSKLSFYAITFSFLFLSAQIHAKDLCFKEAGQYYNIDPLLLKSIAKIESNFRQNAIGENKNVEGKIISRDYGIMQINQLHIPKLIEKKVISSADDLILDPCLNIQIGAWILYNHFQKCGVNWQCVGTYNTGFANKGKVQRQYIFKVYQAYLELSAEHLNMTKKKPNTNPASAKK